MSDEEVEVTFRFPRELVEQADVAKLAYWAAMAKDPHCTPLDRFRSALNTQILEWQRAERLKVTPETPNGTEVKIVNAEGEHLEEPILFVGVDPTEPDRYAVVVSGDELLRFVAWDKLRLVEQLTGEDSDE